MFTGIVQGLGELLRMEKNAHDRRLTIAAPAALLKDAQTGDSISVAGVCLTMVDIGAEQFSADLSAETLSRTTLGTAREGCRFNLEPALKAGQPLGGHLVSGHVDACLPLRAREALGRAERLEFGLPAMLARYVAVKGSVCLDGVSLTVNGLWEDAFDVCLIPHTLEVTTLGALQAGQEVNFEVDLVARYLERLQTNRLVQA